ncbi:MAG: hypothetical protein COB45_00725 [Gammaproteobacteria bacterium]|jgi:hypothetical protein|nr:MAG: hypothetical protein COB45_00725 [Gammaproteobacteria bacterium]PHR85214.1 MAG: hypothetical protein COA59_02280 [Colwellia sp.]
MKTTQLILIIFMSCFSAVTFAHAGHDHNSPLALLSHLFWVVPVIIIAAILYSKNLKKEYGIKPTKQK